MMELMIIKHPLSSKSYRLQSNIQRSLVFHAGTARTDNFTSLPTNDSPSESPATWTLTTNSATAALSSTVSGGPRSSKTSSGISTPTTNASSAKPPSPNPTVTIPAPLFRNASCFWLPLHHPGSLIPHHMARVRALRSETGRTLRDSFQP